MGDKQQALAQAKQLEQASRVEDAVHAYLQAGSLTDAVRVFVDARRYVDAGNLVLRALRCKPAEVGKLKGPQRRLAHRAASYYVHGGEHETAIAIFAALGDRRAVEQVRTHGRGPSSSPGSSRPPRPSQVHELGGGVPVTRGSRPMRRPTPRQQSEARPKPQATPVPTSSPRPQSSPPVARTPSLAPPPTVPASALSKRRARELERSGDLELARDAYAQLRMFSDAGRVTRELGDPATAARWFVEGGRPYDAGMCYLDAGNTGEALTHLVHVPRDDPNYRAACTRAIKLARELNTLDFDLDRFVSRFVRSGPNGPRELSAFYALGRLYEAHDFSTSAVDVYERIQGQEEEYLDVSDRLDDIGHDARGSEMVFEKIVREDAAFHKAPLRKVRSADRMAELPDLPDLPPLPDLDQIPRSRSRPPRESQPGPAPGVAPEPHPHDVVSDPHERATDVGAPPAEQPRQPPRSQPGAATSPVPAAADAATLPPASEEAEIRVGSLIAERYKVRREIGEGGMAMIYEVLDRELDLPIALKLFSPGVDDEVLQSRFKRELMLARELTHENIVRVFDIGVHHGRRFITMELLDGVDLRDAMDGPLEMEQAFDYLEQMCAGLHVAHLRGIVHRDIKPENFFVTLSGQVKVMDFGIAKKAMTKSHITQEGYTAGTPAYMAPEQIKDFGHVTHQCDVYALGVIAYEMFTGELPFYHDEPMPLMMMHIESDPPPPRLLRSEISESLEDLLLHTLVKRPGDRVKTCAELADRLEEERDVYRKSR